MGRSLLAESNPSTVNQRLVPQKPFEDPVLLLEMEDISLHNDYADRNTGSLSESESSLPEDEPPTRRAKSHRKSVSFASLNVREYNTVIGDHPCCTMGCPLSLGWQYSDASAVPLDRYEATRSPRRSREQLRTTCEERRQILSEEGNYSEGELRKAQRKLHRARSCSARLCERMNASFFQDAHNNYNACEVSTR